MQCKFVTRKVVTSRCFGGGSGGMTADRALGEKNAMLGTGVLVIMVQSRCDRLGSDGDVHSRNLHKESDVQAKLRDCDRRWQALNSYQRYDIRWRERVVNDLVRVARRSKHKAGRETAGTEQERKTDE